MALRRQLPAYSPLSIGAVSSAVGATLHEPRDARRRMALRLCEIYGTREAMLVGSGTIALRLALEGVAVEAPGRPIALPAYSCYDVASAADGAGLDVVLYDIDPRTLGPDESSLRRALGQGPAALVTAHLYGYPVDLKRISGLAYAEGTLLIEDAAQGAGGRLWGSVLGSFGSLAVLSFGRGKGTSAGAGGALLARDEMGTRVLRWAAGQIPTPSRGYREAALLAAQWMFGRPALYGIPASIPALRLGETVYHPPRTPSAMSGAGIGALPAALRDSHAEVERRRAMAEHLTRMAAAGSRVKVVEPVEGAEPGYLRLPVLPASETRAAWLKALAARGVASGYPAPLIDLSPFRDRVLNAASDFPGARALAETLVTLPTHRFLSSGDLTALEGWLV